MFRNFQRNKDEDNICIQVDDTERRIIVRALADLRDKQRMAHKNYDFCRLIFGHISYIIIRL